MFRISQLDVNEYDLHSSLYRQGDLILYQRVLPRRLSGSASSGAATITLIANSCHALRI